MGILSKIFSGGAGKLAEQLGGVYENISKAHLGKKEFALEAKKLLASRESEIEATIRSNTVAISGNVTGNVCAVTKVVLHKTAVVDGDIDAPSIVIEEGAKLNGQVKMTGAAAKQSGGGSLKAVPNGGSQS